MGTDDRRARGIDVSRWNGSTPSLVGRDFLFARACYGTERDPMYDQHIRKAKQAGVVTGAYAFGIFGDGAVQARAFLRIADEVDLWALDLEKESGKPRMTAAQARAFIAEVRSTGRSCGLYHSQSSFPSLGQDWNWIARWGDDEPTSRWAFWQYRGHPLDLNYYNGDADELRRFAEVTGESELIKSRGALVMKEGNAAFTKRVRITQDTSLYETPGGARLAGTKTGYVYPYVGWAAKGTRAVLVNTAKPYSDGQPGPTVLYVAAGATVVEDAPVPPPTGDIEQDVTVTWSVNGQVVGSETFNV